MGKSSATTEETIDIENAGNRATLILEGRTIVSLAIRGDGAATYQLDARERGGSWKQDVGKEFSGQSDYDDVLETGAQEIGVRCSTGTGSAGDQATITLMAGGG